VLIVLKIKSSIINVFKNTLYTPNKTKIRSEKNVTIQFLVSYITLVITEKHSGLFGPHHFCGKLFSLQSLEYRIQVEVHQKKPLT